MDACTKIKHSRQLILGALLRICKEIVRVCWNLLIIMNACTKCNPRNLLFLRIPLTIFQNNLSIRFQSMLKSFVVAQNLRRLCSKSENMSKNSKFHNFWAISTCNTSKESIFHIEFNFKQKKYDSFEEKLKKIKIGKIDANLLSSIPNFSNLR